MTAAGYTTYIFNASHVIRERAAFLSTVRTRHMFHMSRMAAWQTTSSAAAFRSSISLCRPSIGLDIKSAQDGWSGGGITRAVENKHECRGICTGTTESNDCLEFSAQWYYRVVTPTGWLRRELRNTIENRGATPPIAHNTSLFLAPGLNRDHFPVVAAQRTAVFDCAVAHLNTNRMWPNMYQQVCFHLLVRLLACGICHGHV